MRALRMLVRTLVVVFVTFSISQAKTNYAYVANNSANTVSVIDTANNTIVKTVTVGTGPWYVAVNQAGSVAYVTNESSNNVSVISTTTNAVVATIPVGSEPNGVAFAPSGKTAYVTNDGAGTVSVINTGTKKVTATVTVGTRPVGVAVTPNGAFVYVANLTSGTVSVISTLTNAVVATVSVGNGPTYLAVSPNGTTVYVPNFGSNDVSVIRTADNAVINTISVPGGVWGAAVSPDGELVYVTDYVYGSGNLVTVIDTATQQVTGSIVVGSFPLGTAFSQDSAFAYVANSSSGNVSVIDTASGTVAATIGVGTNPIGAAVMGTMKVSTVIGGYVGDKGPAKSAAFNAPYSSVYDKAGNLYISDFLMNRIRRVTPPPSSTITTYAGTGVCGYNGENIKATEAMLCYPNGLALDAAGDLIVADSDSRIRKITSKGAITTIVGTGVYGNNGNGGPALNAEIGQPYGIAYDAAGDLYFADVADCVVWEVNTSGTIYAVAGNGTCSYNGNGSPATSYELDQPRGIAVDGNGNIYIGDTLNNLVREVTPAGVISNFVEVDRPRYLFLQNGTLYISTDSQMQSVNLTNQMISTYAGSYFGYDGDGNPLLATEFTIPSMIFDPGGNPVFDDPLNARVRAATGGIVNTIAGGYLGDGGKATSAALVFPEALAIDKSNNFYIADFTGNRVREVSGGTISTIAGTGVSGFLNGAVDSATLYAPEGVAVDSHGNVFIADTYNGVIREVSGGAVTTFATNANFNYLLQMATDTANNLYVADNGACVVWKITPAAMVSIAAGVLNACGYNEDGISATSAELNGPYSVALDSSGDLFIADNGNNRIREVNTSGKISTVTGNNTCADTGDGGPATSAEICGPYGVAVAKSGTLYLSDADNRIRQISGGMITTYAGTGGNGFNGDGLWPLLTDFDEPIAIALDSKGNLYVLDDTEHRVREIH